MQIKVAWGQALQWKKGKRGEIQKISASELSQAVVWGYGKDRHPFPSPDRFFFSRTLIVFSFLPQCGAWSQAKIKGTIALCFF